MRKLFRMYSILLLLLVLPIQISAHGNNYFEFNPDYFKTKSLYVSPEDPVYQIFLPVNEYLGGVDFWFDNSGDSGPVTFSLYNQAGSLVASKTLNIQRINPVAGGQRVHIDWDSQVSVAGSNKYKVKIESALPSLRIYYSDRVGFLGHNAPYTSGYVNGVAEVRGEEKEFSFKFSLVERSETSLPVISGLIVSTLSYDQVRMDFSVNEPADYKLEYGLNGQNYNQIVPYSGNYTVCPSGVASCSLLLNVAPNNSYQYVLTVKDVWGNIRQASGTFSSQSLGTTTPIPSLSQSQTPTPSITVTSTPGQSLTPTPEQDTIPPVINNLRLVHLDDKSASFAWDTDEAANSSVIISFTTEKITIAAASDPTLELVHLIKIDGTLDPDTHYFARIISKDASDNTATALLEFTTLKLGQTSPSPLPPPGPIQNPLATIQPQLSFQPRASPDNQLVTVESSPEDPESSIDVIWQAPESEPSSGYRIDIFDADHKLIKTETVEPGVHEKTISGLPSGEKLVIVYKNNGGIFEKIDKPVQFGNDTFAKRLLALWPYLLMVATLLGVLYWIRKRHTSQVVQQVVP